MYFTSLAKSMLKSRWQTHVLWAFKSSGLQDVQGIDFLLNEDDTKCTVGMFFTLQGWYSFAWHQENLQAAKQNETSTLLRTVVQKERVSGADPRATKISTATIRYDPNQPSACHFTSPQWSILTLLFGARLPFRPQRVSLWLIPGWLLTSACPRGCGSLAQFAMSPLQSGSSLNFGNYLCAPGGKDRTCAHWSLDLVIAYTRVPRTVQTHLIMLSSMTMIPIISPLGLLLTG